MRLLLIILTHTTVLFIGLVGCTDITTSLTPEEKKNMALFEKHIKEAHEAIKDVGSGGMTKKRQEALARFGLLYYSVVHDISHYKQWVARLNDEIIDMKDWDPEGYKAHIEEFQGRIADYKRWIALAEKQRDMVVRAAAKYGVTEDMMIRQTLRW